MNCVYKKVSHAYISMKHINMTGAGHEDILSLHEDNWIVIVYNVPNNCIFDISV